MSPPGRGVGPAAAGGITGRHTCRAPGLSPGAMAPSPVEEPSLSSDRQRSLLPLPVPPAPQLDSARWASLSGVVRRRLHRRHGRDQLVREVVTALNEMDSGGSEEVRPHTGKLNLVQKLAMERLERACAGMGAPPAGLTTEVAVRELQVASTYDATVVAESTPLTVDLVSLPAEG